MLLFLFYAPMDLSDDCESMTAEPVIIIFSISCTNIIRLHSFDRTNTVTIIIWGYATPNSRPRLDGFVSYINRYMQSFQCSIFLNLRDNNYA